MTWQPAVYPDIMINTPFLVHTFNSMPEAVVLADTDRNIISVNKAFESIFGYTQEDVLGKKTSFLYAYQSDFKQAGNRRFNKSADSETSIYEVLYKKKDGEFFVGETTANVVKDEGDVTIGFLGIIRDITIEKKRQEELKYLSDQFNTLVDITTGEKEEIASKINKALKLTTEFLGLEVGIISSIADETYTVRYFYPENVGLNRGDTFELGETYCSITHQATDVIAIDHMSVSEHNVHPCYSKFKLESYIGIPLKIGGKIRGTINFSSSKPREVGFSNSDKDMIRLLSKWLSTQLEQDEVEQELKDSREEYKLITERSTELVCVHTPDGTYDYVSPSSEWILGYKPEELKGTNPYEYFHPDDIESIQEEAHKQSLAGQRILNTEYRYKNKAGDYIWLATATEPIINEAGVVTGLQTSSRDITEKKRLEILYNQSQQMATVGGWEYDLISGDLYWTDEVYRIHEKDPSEGVLIDEAINYYPDDGTREILQNALQETIETGATSNLELPIDTAKGNRKFVNAIINAARANGVAYKLYGTFQDITERNRVSQNLKDKNEQLNKLIETTHEINSIIGHDLKSPLSSIAGLADIMLFSLNGNDVIETEEVKETLGLIVHTSKNMAQLIDDLFQWSRLQTGNFEVVKKEHNLREIIDPTIELLQSPAKQKEILLMKTCGDDILLDVDKTIVTTIIRNFISNAIKFTNEGGKISVSCEQNSKQVKLSVTDNGEGMTDEVMEKMFHPSEHPTRYGTHSETGTGLGLKLCNKLAQVHGAKIDFESELGKGSTFSLCFPV